MRPAAALLGWGVFLPPPQAASLLENSPSSPREDVPVSSPREGRAVTEGTVQSRAGGFKAGGFTRSLGYRLSSASSYMGQIHIGFRFVKAQGVVCLGFFHLF